MSSNSINKFRESQENKEFASQILSWLENIFYKNKKGFSTETSSDVEQDEELEFIETLGEIFKNTIKSNIKKYPIEIIPLLFDINIKIITATFDIYEIEQKFSIEDIVQIFLKVIFDLKSEKPEIYASLIPYQQFLPETIDFISNKIANGVIPLKWVNPNYWKQVFENITDSEDTKSLRFSIRSLIPFINLLDNEERRLIGLRS